MESWIVLKSHSKHFDYLKNVTSDVGLIHLKQSEITSEIKDLILYLTNKNIAPSIWDFNKLPVYIFTNQFNSQLLITITKDDQSLDEFSKSFAKEKIILTSATLIN